MSTKPATASQLLALSLGCLFAFASASALHTPPAVAQETDSAKTVKASSYDPSAKDAPFPDLKLTVSQTEDLIQQGITVSWTGGKQSQVPNQQTGGNNFLQFAQCWGDEPGSGGTRPDRTTCQYGGLNVPGDTRQSTRSNTASIAAQDAQYTAPGAGWWEPTLTAIPFRAPNGDTVATVVDGKRVANPPDLNNNQYFTKFTTNEVSWAGSGADGSGSVSYELQTVQQAPGLGCGERITNTDGTTSARSCWLVAIPRGSSDPDSTYITQSGLIWDTWKHHLAIKLNFKTTGLTCASGSAERQLSGSELLSTAVSQWQPKLCNRSGGAVYSMLTGPESDAAAAANGTSTAPLALTARPLSSEAGTDNLAYAPIGLTGVSIAFAIDRNADAFKKVPQKVIDAQNLAFESMKLTPRLLAKLLTSSYRDALPAGSDKSHLSDVQNLTQDPDFLAVNDSEWAYMALYGPGIADLQVPLGRSDTAAAIWRYVLADADAAAFLAGKVDPWGMKVNPYYSTSSKLNPTGTGLVLPRDDFPKADPSQFAGNANRDYADAINLVTWRPYTSSLDASAYLVLRGDAQILGDWDASAVPPKYGKAQRNLVGLRRVIGVTGTGSASRYQVVQASLRNPAGKYVGPSELALTKAAAAMTTTKTQKQVVGFDSTTAAAKKATEAYPLTMPIYAAVNPKMSDAKVRSDYAAFISYVVAGGQVRGTGDGELPAGYGTLPTAWKKQALAAAAAIKAGAWPTTGTTPTKSATPKATSPRSTSTAGPSSSTATAPGKPSAENPSGTGTSSSQLSGASTPADPGVGVLTAVVPTSAAIGLLAALGVPLMSRLRRRQP